VKRYSCFRRWCVIAIVSLMLLSQTVVADDPASANREAIVICLRNMAARAQRWYHTSISEDGWSGTFAIATLSALISRPVNAYGSFTLSSPSATSLVLTGTGVETGNDGATPVEVVVTMYADSSNMVVTN